MVAYLNYVVKNLLFAYIGKTKMQISCSSSQADQCLHFSLPGKYNCYNFLIQNLKTLLAGQAGFCLTWLKTPEDRFLAHLSQRLIGELIVYPCSVVVVVVLVHHFQRSSPLKLLDQSKPNFMWSLLGKGERKFV